MVSDHLSTTSNHLYGDYELRMRAPYTAGASGSECSDGIYAYFTAGYQNVDGVWNEMNFGFHPDRDMNGTLVSCEHHADSGGYKEVSIDLGILPRFAGQRRQFTN